MIPFKKMADAGTGVIRDIIGLLCTSKHALVRILVALNVGGKGKPTFWPTVPEILDSLLQLGGQRIFCPSTEESII